RLEAARSARGAARSSRDRRRPRSPGPLPTRPPGRRPRESWFAFAYELFSPPDGWLRLDRAPQESAAYPPVFRDLPRVVRCATLRTNHFRGISPVRSTKQLSVVLVLSLVAV